MMLRNGTTADKQSPKKRHLRKSDPRSWSSKRIKQEEPEIHNTGQIKRGKNSIKRQHANPNHKTAVAQATGKSTGERDHHHLHWHCIASNSTSLSPFFLSGARGNNRGSKKMRGQIDNQLNQGNKKQQSQRTIKTTRKKNNGLQNQINRQEGEAEG